MLAIILLNAGISSCYKTPVDAVTSEASASFIDGQYIVVLKGTPSAGARLSGTYESRRLLVQQQANGLLTQLGIDTKNIGHLYNTVLKGFSAQLTAGQVTLLRQNPAVSYIEQDRRMTGEEPKRVLESGARAPAPQQTPWGIAAVGGPITYTGNSAAWLIDTGIDLKHPDLNVDSTRGKIFVAGTTTLQDQDGHGTHMAGIIGAINNSFGVVGVAAGAAVIPVKVSKKYKEMTEANFLAGVDYVAANAQLGDVVNMSVSSSPTSDAIDTAVLNLVMLGKVFASMSASNDYGQGLANSNLWSPAHVNAPNLYTVSAYDSKGVFASVSCYGNPPIDFSAPGVDIRSTAINGGYTTFTQGTSMSTAHVSGILLATGGVVYGKGFVTKDKDDTPDAKASCVP